MIRPACFGTLNLECLCGRLFALGSQAGFDIPKAFPIGQPGKGHDPLLIETKKALDAEVAPITVDASTEIACGQKFMSWVDRSGPEYITILPRRCVGKVSSDMQIR